GSRAPWRCCRSLGLRPRSSGSAPSSSSACSAPPAPPGFSAELPLEFPISSYATYPGWAGTGVDARPADLPATAAAHALPRDTTAQSAAAPAPCAPGPTPTPYDSTFGHASNTPPRATRAPGPCRRRHILHTHPPVSTRDIL